MYAILVYTAVDSLPLCTTKVSYHVLRVSPCEQQIDSKRKLRSSMYYYSLPTCATADGIPTYTTANGLPTCTMSPSTDNRETQGMYNNSLLACHAIISQFVPHSQHVLQQSPSVSCNSLTACPTLQTCSTAVS